MQPLLKYTTEVPASKTVGEIMAVLSEHRATATMQEYEEKTGRVSAVSFRIKTPFGLMTYRLPANVAKVHAVLCRQRLQPRFQTIEHAERVAWRIVLDWLRAQLAMIQADQVSFDQVMLPFVQGQDGRTLYDTLAAGKFHGLALTDSNPS